MWIPGPLVKYFTSLNNAADRSADIAQETLAQYRQDLAVVRAERDLLSHQLTVSQTQFDWLRMRVNQVEAERAVLLGKLTGLPMAAPEILRTPAVSPDLAEQNFSFEDLGDALSAQLKLQN